jgi:hypothetical protein
MEGRILRLEDQFGRIETLLLGINGHVGALDKRMGALEGRMGAIENRMGAIEGRMGGLEDRITGLDDRVRKLEIGSGELRGRVYNLPSTWAVVTTVIGGQITLAALLLGALKMAH